MKNYISTFGNLTLKYFVFAFFVGFGLLFFGCKSKEVIDPKSEYVIIPDINFEKALIQLKIDDVQDGKVLRASIFKVTSLNISSQTNKIKDLIGIGEFVNLITLNCGSNQLTNLDVSKNIVLTDLYCYNNQLTNLDVSKNIALRILSCGSNQLTNLNVSKNIALTDLRCYYNQLTNLDISKNIALTYLESGANQLTNLDVSKNIALINLNCLNNKIQTICVNNLNQVTSYWYKDPIATYKVCP